jgi:hypothetical protein
VVTRRLRHGRSNSTLAPTGHSAAGHQETTYTPAVAGTNSREGAIVVGVAGGLMIGLVPDWTTGTFAYRQNRTAGSVTQAGFKPVVSGVLGEPGYEVQHG